MFQPQGPQRLWPSDGHPWLRHLGSLTPGCNDECWAHHTQIGAGGKAGSVQAGTCTGDLDLHDRDKFTQNTMVSPARREEWLNQKSNVNPLRLSGRKKGGWDILRDVEKGLQRVRNRI